MLQQEYRTNDTIERTVAPDLGGIARSLRDKGISTVPIKADGSKAPCIAWKSYQGHLPTDDDLTQWYDNGIPKGIAVIGGKVSSNLEVLDIDEPQLVEQWKQVVEELRPGLVARLVQSETPSGGAHFFYRHDDEPTGNQKLAQDERLNEKGELSPYTLIETRGEGGYAIVPPSPASCHPDHKPYRYVQGELGQVPTITTDERHILLEAARLFNSYVKPSRDYKASYRPLAAVGDRPGDDYNATGDWEELLTDHGWTVCYRKGDMIAWTRPDKGRGVSATTNHNGSNRLYVFSSNADPFDADTAYDLFGAYTLLEHDGDCAAAARDLAQQGYGHSRTYGMSEPDLNNSIFSNKSTAYTLVEALTYDACPDVPFGPVVQSDKAATVLNVASGDVVDWLAENHTANNLQTVIKAMKPQSKRLQLVTYEDLAARPLTPMRYLVHPYLPAGEFTLLYGPPKSYKSFLAMDWALSIASGYQLLGGDSVEQGLVLYLDLENALDRLRERVDARLAYNGLTTASLQGRLILQDRNKSATPWRAESDAIQELGNAVTEYAPVLVVIDNLRKALPAKVNENHNDEVNPILNDLINACGKADSALLLVHHTNRGNELFSGAGCLESTPANTISINKDRNSGIATVRSVVTRNAQDFEPFGVHMVDKALRLTDAVDIQPPQSDVITSALLDKDLTVKELVEATGLTESKVRAQVERLAQTGKIIVVDERQGAKGGKAAKVYRLAE